MRALLAFGGATWRAGGFLWTREFDEQRKGCSEMNAWVKGMTGLVLAVGLATAVHAEDKTLRIGFQKYGTLILLKS